MAKKIVEEPRTLEEDQCAACRCYCFGYPPYQWKIRQTPKGLIQLCGSCDSEYAGVPDPVKEARIRSVSAALSRAENCAARVSRLEAELDRLYSE